MIKRVRFKNPASPHEWIVSKVSLSQYQFNVLQASMSDFRMQLNNWAQLHRHNIRYEHSQSRLRNGQTGWTAIVRINEEEWGRGRAGSKDDAEELAAQQALNVGKWSKERKN
ncbi:hypothetical protein D9758_009870 [Tetrapyrgos nigripes]|uniref:DRBM domain-containing protein n=1 Tax=Tetrapyrgos nigripes TaxID=182062 RepID=A0A8H5GMG6_9AGAR|nr:hypothetical protein D9758_009870 [Tetrapyrgos nigripes]